MNYKISIIIPVYNKEEFIEECINSIINQTFDDYEAIFINDGSSDNSLEILKKYEDRKNFKIISQENSGPATARNVGLKKACGEYVFFLDADDWIENDSLEKLYQTAKNNDSEIVLFNAVEHFPDNKLKKRIYHIHAKKDTDYENFSFDYNNNINLVMNGYHIVCTKLHKLEFIKDNNLEFKKSDLFEDVYFHVKTMINAKRISYNPNMFYHYRRTQKQTRQNTTITTNKSFVMFDIFQQVEGLLKENNLDKKLYMNFIKFKVNESYNIFHNVQKQYFSEAFDKVQIEFRKMQLTQSDILRLPQNHQIFYKAILSSDSINSYYKQEKLIKTKEFPIRLLKKVKHSLFG